jgi:hypothetical protein
MLADARYRFSRGGAVSAANVSATHRFVVVSRCARSQKISLAAAPRNNVRMSSSGTPEVLTALPWHFIINCKDYAPRMYTRGVVLCLLIYTCLADSLRTNYSTLFLLLTLSEHHFDRYLLLIFPFHTSDSPSIIHSWLHITKSQVLPVPSPTLWLALPRPSAFVIPQSVSDNYHLPSSLTLVGYCTSRGSTS